MRPEKPKNRRPPRPPRVPVLVRHTPVEMRHTTARFNRPLISTPVPRIPRGGGGETLTRKPLTPNKV